MHSRYVIDEGAPLHGSVELSGAKNAATKQLVASLLTEESCTFQNVPRNLEIDTVLRMLTGIGAQHEWQERHILNIQTRGLIRSDVGVEYSGANRIPILLIGPLLHRAGKAFVPAVGGCNIGARPVDFHIHALSLLGATIEQTANGFLICGERLRGSTIHLPYPSVGATESILLSAVLAVGRTTILNAAIEPEIIDTVLFLQKMGAMIHVDVARRIVIDGVERLHGANHDVIPDRIEAASFAAAAVATNGRITVQNARQQDMIPFLNVLRKIGGGFQANGQSITFFKERDLAPTHIETDVFPGFATDWQPLIVSLLTAAHGTSVIHETVYEQRFGYTEALQRMGADININTDCLGPKPCRFAHKNQLHSCIVHGPKKLSAAPLAIPDLRAGFSYIIAALMADGATEISNVHYLERGYGDLVEKLRSLGARIKSF